MKPADVAKSYDQIAGHWNSDKFNRKNGLDAHERALRFLRSGDKALDVGCGSSGRILDGMLEAGLAPEAVDVSPEMVRLARERHPQVPFYVADIGEWQLPGLYDFISAWDSIWHAPLDKQEEILRKLCAGLQPGGVLIFTAGGTDQPGEVDNPLMGQPMLHTTLGTPGLLAVLADAGCICRHLEYDQYPELHLVIIAQKAD